MAGANASAPREKVKWYRQTGWLLAASLLCYALAAVGLRLALGAGFSALFAAWGVDASTVARAPGWARLVYRWHGSAITLLAALAGIALSRWLRGLWRMDAGGENDSPSGCIKADTLCLGSKGLSRFAAYALYGLAAATAILLIDLLPDSLRAEWAAPRLAWALLPLCAVAFASTLAEEMFTKRVLYDGVERRWGRLWATVVSVAAFFVIARGYAGNILSAVNVVLLGWIGCLVYRRSGLWAATGLHFGWSAATVFLFGYGGGEASVWRFYGVSENLLTGGDAGFVCGLYLTAALIAAIVWLVRRR